MVGVVNRSLFRPAKLNDGVISVGVKGVGV